MKERDREKEEADESQVAERGRSLNFIFKSQNVQYLSV